MQTHIFYTVDYKLICVSDVRLRFKIIVLQ